MLEKTIVLSLMYILAFGTDIRTLRNSPSRAKTVYFGIMLFALYFSVDYLIEPDLPDMNTLADVVLTKTAWIIVEFLKVKPT